MDGVIRVKFSMLLMTLILVLTPLTNLPVDSGSLDNNAENSVSTKAQTTWNGLVQLTESYTVSVTDELLISPCTTVELSTSSRLFVDGRLIIQGNNSCPVVFSQLGSGLHYGIQFNSSSSGRGSVIDNITIEDATYGITIYGSDPQLNNVTITNPSRVGIDLFSGANPVIHDLIINQAGKGFSYSDWRYGLGLSVGAGSTPVVERATMTDLRIRGLNIWGSSGGIYRDISIDNVSAEGANAISAGVWIEDSQPLITNLSVDKSDYGILIRHVSDGGFTRAVVRDCIVTNSMYRGIYVDKSNHTNFTNYETADFTNTIVRGTGGPNAKTAGIGFAAIEVNATGAWFENTTVEDSTTVGVRLYFVDASTTFRNLTITDSGDPGEGAHEAGLAIRSSFFAPRFENLAISGSVGPGISATSGGAMQGSDWFLHNNSKDGLFIESSTVIVDHLHLSDNGESGSHVFDSRYVTLSNLTAIGNGNLGLNEMEQAGLFFEKSNDLESSSGDVTCNYCTVSNSAGSGVMVKDSVDLFLNHLTVENNNPSYDPITVDNSGLSLGQQGGRFHMHDVLIITERQGTDAGPAIRINRAAGNIDTLVLQGNHSGMVWNANNNGNYPSELSRAQLSGTSCLLLIDHSDLMGQDNTIVPECTGSITLQNSQVNWSSLTDLTASTAINLDSFSKLHLHQPQQIDFSSAIIAPSAEIDIAWDIEVWVQNNNSNGIPSAPVIISFDQFEPNAQENANDIGYVKFPNFIGQQWTQSGASSLTTVTIDCAYDGLSNSSSVSLDGDKTIYCILPIDNQPPFLYWDTPESDSIYPSGSEVEFNANRSWDIDDDALIWEWTSSIDGNIGDSANFTVNQGDVSQTLSDGVHTITAKLCDDKGHCVQQTRTIELSNFAPIVFAEFSPALNAFNELIIAKTGTVIVNLSGTYDPEGDALNCWMATSYGLLYPIQSMGANACPETIEYTFPLESSQNNPAPEEDNFLLSIFVDDGVNQPVELAYSTMLYNEIPEPNFTVIRSDNFSQSVVTLDGSSTVDPEGDNLAIEFYSNLDGILQWSDEPSGTVWQGHLSRGIHTIEMRVTDDSLEHVEQYKVSSILVSVLNTPPSAGIVSPSQADSYDSSEPAIFSANGSGDFDSVCSSFNSIGFWLCSQNEPYQGSEYLQVSWTSDLDGRLSSTNQEGLFYQARLSSGIHTITLEIDDGINPSVTDTTTIQVSKSAPVLSLATPDVTKTFKSSEFIFWNAVNSLDYDGDNFAMSVRSDKLTEPILLDVDSSITHMSQLSAGTHNIEITLTDDDGMVRTEFFELIVEPSAPEVVIINPVEGQSFTGGIAIILEEESTDADFDITFRQWKILDKSNGEIVETLSGSTESIILSPGEYLIELTVRDSLLNTEVVSRNIRVEKTDPVLDEQSIVVTPGELTTNQLVDLQVSVALSDPDGTTQDVQATIIHGIQVWDFALQDLDGDGIWTGSVEVNPDKSGRPSLKITARDGLGDSATISQVSKTIVVNDADSTSSNTPLIVGGVGMLSLILITLIIARVRKNRLEGDLIESWDTFKQPSAAKEHPDVEQGDVEQTTDIVNDLWSQLEQEEGLN